MSSINDVLNELNKDYLDEVVSTSSLNNISTTWNKNKRDPIFTEEQVKESLEVINNSREKIFIKQLKQQRVLKKDISQQSLEYRNQEVPNFYKVLILSDNYRRVTT